MCCYLAIQFRSARNAENETENEMVSGRKEKKKQKNASKRVEPELRIFILEFGMLRIVTCFAETMFTLHPMCDGPIAVQLQQNIFSFSARQSIRSTCTLMSDDRISTSSSLTLFVMSMFLFDF